MLAKRLLFLTRHRLTLFPWDRGEVSAPSRFFDPTAEGYQAFSCFFAESPHVPVYFLVDLVEEEFRNDSIPHVSGMDRAALVQRHVARTFVETSFRHASLQGREQRKERQEDRIVSSGITDPGLLLPWIDILRERHVSLAGIFSLPLVSVHLLKLLDAVTPATLLVSWQSTSGLRLSFFSGQYLRMSRMAPAPAADPEQYAHLFVSELENTRSYLNSLRLMPSDVPLQVTLCTSPEMLDAVKARCTDSATARFQFVTVSAVAKRIGIKRPITTPFSDSIFIQLLGKGSLRNQYATSDMMVFYFSRLLRKTLYVISLALMVISFIFCSYFVISGSRLKQQAQSKKSEAEALVAQYRESSEVSRSRQVAAADYKNVVDLAEKLQQQRASPKVLWILLSQSLESLPYVRIDKLLWTGPEIVKKTSPHSGSQTSKLRLDQQRATVWQSLQISAEVEKTGGDLALAMNRIDGWLTVLRGYPGVEQVELVEAPAGAKNKDTLQGDVLQRQVVEEVARFVVKIFYRSKVVVHKN
ncbi:MAG: hypothetical protein H7835_12615 [Magnetococcus sp. XQGC-1]